MVYFTTNDEYSDGIIGFGVQLTSIYLYYVYSLYTTVCICYIIYHFQEEVSLKGYSAHLSGVSAPAPLTDREEALKELQQSETNTDFSTDSR